MYLGSSIATSLCEGESKPKHVGLLKVNKQDFVIDELRLKSTRPFVFDNIILRDHDIKVGVSLAESISQYVDQYIEHDIMPKVTKQLTGMLIVLNYSFVSIHVFDFLILLIFSKNTHDIGYPGQPLQPLIRLRIFHENDNQIFDTLRFENIILFYPILFFFLTQSISSK